jgi:hypothetical protein
MTSNYTDNDRMSFLVRLGENGTKRKNLVAAMPYLPLGCIEFAMNHEAYFVTAPGSGHNHQAWTGGYADHLDEIFAIAAIKYQALSQLRPLPFTLLDALLVLFLHDSEKPFKRLPEHLTPPAVYGHLALTDEGALKQAICQDYHIQLTAEQQNALKYVHGENEDRRADARVAGPLATLCHEADMWSARGWHNQPQEGGPLPDVVSLTLTVDWAKSY